MRLPSRLSVLAAIVGLGALALPGAPSLVEEALAGVIAPQLAFESYTLPNGLQVILSEDHRVPLVAVDIWYHVGARNEVPGRSGFAHLFEHIMFQGSRNVPEDRFFPILEGAGAPLVNGTTDFDRTNYFETVPANQLDLALWLESDRMGFLLDTLTQERLDNQRAVVRKERQQSTENVPYGVAEEQFIKLLYPAPHPYNGVVIGSHEDLEAATLEDVKAFFRTWYVPNNATLVIVGDFKPADVKARVEKYFGSLPKGAEPPKLDVKVQPIPAEKRLALTDDVELSKVYFGWLSPNAYSAGDAELQLAARVLTDGKASRLHKVLVEEQQIATEVKAVQYPCQLGSFFQVDIQGRPGRTPAELEAAAWPLIEALAKAPVSADELSRAVRTWQADTLRGLEALGGFGGKADVFNTYNHYVGDPAYLPKDFARMDAVTPQSLQQAFAATVRADNRVVVHVTPEAKTEGGAK